METFNLLEELFDKKMLKVIKFFLSNKDKTFYLQEISKSVNVPLATVFRIVRKLNDLGVVEEVHIKKFRIYRCALNDKVAFLESFMKEGKRMIEAFAASASKIPNVEEIVIYGKEAEDRANIILMGKSIDNNEVKKVCTEFKEKYNYTVTPLTLEKEQYEQMTAMGLYSGQKKVLFRKSP